MRYLLFIHRHNNCLGIKAREFLTYLRIRREDSVAGVSKGGAVNKLVEDEMRSEIWGTGWGLACKGPFCCCFYPKREGMPWRGLRKGMG